MSKRLFPSVSKVSVVDPADYEEWDEMLCALEEYSFFHSSAWAAVLSQSYLYTPTYFTLLDNDRIAALLPLMDVRSALTGHRGVSLPFSDQCEPLFNNKYLFRGVFDQIVEFAKKVGWKSVELRGGEGFLDDAPPCATYFGHTLCLSSNEKDLFSGFKDSNRRNIKKALKEGVEVKILNSFESVTEFVALNNITRKYHGLPPQPYYFFKRMYDHIISGNKGSVAIAYYKNKAIASAVYFHLGDKVVYKYGASDRNYQHLRANNLVMWEAIRYYCQEGYKSLCFGRTDTDNEGLRRFKSDWGTQERIIHYYKYDLKRGSFVTSAGKGVKLANKVFNKMPTCLLNFVGSLLYRHVG